LQSGGSFLPNDRLHKNSYTLNPEPSEPITIEYYPSG